MTTTIVNITNEVEARLSELDELIAPLEDERATLLQVVTELNTPSTEQQKVVKAAPKKTQRRDDHKTVTTKSRKRGEHLERGERKAQIRELLAQDWTPLEIAEELGTHVNYVRLVQRQDRDAAQTKRGSKRVNVTAKAKR